MNTQHLPVVSSDSVASGTIYIERAVRFGAHGGLVGVLTEPERLVDNAPVVLVANVGLNHHVGPHRLWVDLARNLAERGFATLRFDSAGLGDSEPRRETVPDIERACLDLQDAMDLGRKQLAATRFVLIALCSGVDSAHRVALRASQVVGAAFIDGYSHRTPGFYFRHYMLRPLQWTRWRRFVRRRWVQRTTGTVSRGAEEGEAIFERHYPSVEQLRSDFDVMLARNKRLFFAYTGELDVSFNARRQFYEMFPRLAGQAGCEIEYYAKADHVFSFANDRQTLVARLCCWMESGFGESPPLNQLR